MARIKYYDEANGQWKYADMTGISQAAADNRYLQQSVADTRYVNVTGDTMTGSLTMNGGKITMTSNNPYLSMRDTAEGTNNAIWYFQVHQNHLAFGPTYGKASKVDYNGNFSSAGSITVNDKVTMQYNSTTESLDFTFA